MDSIQYGALRNMLLLDLLEGERSISNALFPDHNSSNYLLAGPARCGKTSLLFECAFYAAENNMYVLFITRRKLEELPRFVDERNQPSFQTLKLIEIVYPATVKEYLKFISTCHLKNKKYGLILVDNLDAFYTESATVDIKMAAKLCAYTYDTITHLRKQGCTTFLLCSVTTRSNTAYQDGAVDVVQNWLGNLLLVYPHHSGDGFVIKSESKYVKRESNDDVSIQGVRAIFRDDKICLQ